jgi:hypothetical protein
VTQASDELSRRIRAFHEFGAAARVVSVTLAHSPPALVSGPVQVKKPAIVTLAG